MHAIDLGSGIDQTVVVGLNNQGDALLSYDQIAHAPPVAALRKADGTVTFLSAPDGSNVLPIGISDSGQIAVRSFAFDLNTGVITPGTTYMTYILNPDGSYTTVNDPVGPNYVMWDFTGFNNKGELSGSIYSALPRAVDGVIQIFLRDAEGTYHTIDQTGSGAEPSLISGALNDHDVMIEHTRYTDG